MSGGIRFACTIPFGVFASNAKLRAMVVPAGDRTRHKRVKIKVPENGPAAANDDLPNAAQLAEDMAREQEASKKWCWAGGLKRAYRHDALVCSDCGAKRKIVATTHDPEQIEHFLKHLRLWPKPDDDLIAIRGPPSLLLPSDEDDQPLPVDELVDDPSGDWPDEQDLAA